MGPCVARTFVLDELVQQTGFAGVGVADDQKLEQKVCAQWGIELRVVLSWLWR